MDKKIIALLALVLQRPESEIASLVKLEDGQEEIAEENIAKLEEFNKERVKKFKEEKQEMFDNGHKKAKKEERSAFENELRTQFGISSDAKGEELYSEIKEVLSKEVKKGNDGAELTEDDIKASKVYQDMYAKMQAEKSDAVKEVEEKFESFKSDIDRKQTMSTVKSKFFDAVKSKNPVLPSDETKANRLLELAAKDLDGYDFDLQDDRIVVKKDGKIYEDDHGNPIGFDKIVESIANSTFDFKDGGKETPGNAGNQRPKVTTEIRSESDFTKAVSEAKSLEEKQAIIATWEEQKAD